MQAPQPNNLPGENPFPIPRGLAEYAAEPDNDHWRGWIARLPAFVAELTARWSLTLGAPYEPGGMCSWVAPARSADGDELVLKMGVRHSEAEHEIDGLRFWGGDGAVRLHDSYTTADTCVLLLERCLPGTSLKQTLPEPAQDEIVAGLLRRLHKEPSAGHPFRPLQSMCNEWGAEFAKNAECYPDKVDPGLVQAGLEIFRTYADSTDRHVLLCTDLHGDNVLAAQREPWLVIDPKPYVGDPAYDAVQHILNCPERLEADPRGFSQRMADLMQLEQERVQTWLFARCVQESYNSESWSQHLASVALRIAP
ncbi:MAG: aminoglycoside phosphotransferase family protein [Caldilineaceae bacterium]